MKTGGGRRRAGMRRRFRTDAESFGQLGDASGARQEEPRSGLPGFSNGLRQAVEAAARHADRDAAPSDLTPGPSSVSAQGFAGLRARLRLAAGPP